MPRKTLAAANWIRVFLLLVCLTLWLPAQSGDVLAAAEEFFASLPGPRSILPVAQFLNTDPEEVALEAEVARASQAEDRSAAELQSIAVQLQEKYDDDTSANMRDPLWARMVALSQSADLAANSAKYQAAYDRREQFRRQSASWLQRNSLARVRAWHGEVVLLLDGARGPVGQEVRFASLVDFRLENKFFQSGYGRYCWTGGYRVRFQSQETGTVRNFGWQHEPRTIERPGKAVTQLFLGRDGWILKFQPVASQNFRVPLPTVSNLLLNLAFLDDPTWPLELAAGTSNSEPGYAVARRDGVVEGARFQGFPCDPKNPKQSGAVVYQRPDGGRVRVGYRLTPLQ